MFSRSFAAIVLVLPVLAGASSIHHPNNAITSTGTNGVRPTTGNLGSATTNQCNTGPIQCCDSVQYAGSSIVASLLESIGATGVGPNIPVGITCSPITVVGIAGGSSCSAQPVCCENNNFNGLVAVGCTPVNIGV